MKTILVPLDGSPFSEHALPAALAIARRGETTIALAHVHQHVVPVASLSGQVIFDPTSDRLIREQELAYLEDVSRRLAAIWDGPTTRILLDAPIADALCAYAHTVGAELIVLSTHGRGGLARAWLGSATDRLLRQSTTPMLVVHPTAEAPALTHEPHFDHILIPLDGSPLAEEAIAMALRVGRPLQARYTLVQAVAPINPGFVIDGVAPTWLSGSAEAEAAAWKHATAYLDEVAARLREQGHTVVTHVAIGRPVDIILDYARAYAVNLIAMTTHGRGGAARLLVGSVADKVLRGAKVPLLVSRSATQA